MSFCGVAVGEPRLLGTRVSDDLGTRRRMLIGGRKPEASPQLNAGMSSAISANRAVGRRPLPKETGRRASGDPPRRSHERNGAAFTGNRTAAPIAGISRGNEVAASASLMVSAPAPVARPSTGGTKAMHTGPTRSAHRHFGKTDVFRSCSDPLPPHCHAATPKRRESKRVTTLQERRMPAPNCRRVMIGVGYPSDPLPLDMGPRADAGAADCRWVSFPLASTRSRSWSNTR